MDIRLIWDFLYDIEIREDLKTGDIWQSILVIIIAIVVEIAFVAFMISMFLF